MAEHEVEAEEEDFEWDAEDFDPDAGFQRKDDRWEGEDEGLNLEAVIAVEAKEAEGKAKPAKKPKEERIAELKAKRRAEEAVKGEAPPAPEEEELSPEQQQQCQLEEKLRLLKVQQDSDLAIAMETFGEKGGAVGGGLDTMQPSSAEEFGLFEEALSKRLLQFETSPHFMTMMETLLRNIGTVLDVEDLRKLSSTLSSMAVEKHKAQKPARHKKKGGKATLGNVGKPAKKMDPYQDDHLGAEFDDFM